MTSVQINPNLNLLEGIIKLAMNFFAWEVELTVPYKKRSFKEKVGIYDNHRAPLNMLRGTIQT